MFCCMAVATSTTRGYVANVAYWCGSCARAARAMLLNHFIKLRAEHSSIVAIKRDMEPVALLALDDEFTRIYRSVSSSS
jgi:hypothetical protein